MIIAYQKILSMFRQNVLRNIVVLLSAATIVIATGCHSPVYTPAPRESVAAQPATRSDTSPSQNNPPAHSYPEAATTQKYPQLAVQTPDFPMRQEGNATPQNWQNYNQYPTQQMPQPASAPRVTNVFPQNAPQNYPYGQTPSYLRQSALPPRPVVHSVTVSQSAAQPWQSGQTLMVAAPKQTYDPAVPAVQAQTLPATSAIEANPKDTQALNVSATSVNKPASEIKTQSEPQVDTRTNVERTLDDLKKLISKQPDDIVAQLALRCLYSAYGQNEKALAELDDIDTQDQNAALSLAEAMVLAAQAADPHNADNTDIANQALASIEQLREKLAEKAEPVITTFKVCSRVDGFGRYDEVPVSQLATGSPQRVLVYCELKNFKHKRNAEGKYLTQLAAQVFLYDSQYRPVVQFMDDVTDLPSYNPRSDFFMRGALDIPSLSPGKYQLVVTMEDKVSQPSRWAQPARIDFEVKSSPAK